MKTDSKNLTLKAKKAVEAKIVSDPETVAYMRTILTNNGMKWSNRDSAKALAGKVYALMIKNKIKVEKQFENHAGSDALAIQKQTGDFEANLKNEWNEEMKRMGVQPPNTKALGFSFGNVWDAIKNVGADLINAKAETEGYDIDIREVLKSSDPENQSGIDKVKEAINETYEAIKEGEKRKEFIDMAPAIITVILLIVFFTLLISKKI